MSFFKEVQNYPTLEQNDAIKETVNFFSMVHSLKTQGILYDIENLFLKHRTVDHFDYSFHDNYFSKNWSNALNSIFKSSLSAWISINIYDKSNQLIDREEIIYDFKHVLLNIHLSCESNGGLHCFKNIKKQERFECYRELIKTHNLSNSFAQAVRIMEQNNKKKKPELINYKIFSHIKNNTTHFPILNISLQAFNDYEYGIYNIEKDAIDFQINEQVFMSELKIFYDIGQLLYSENIDSLNFKLQKDDSFKVTALCGIEKVDVSYLENTINFYKKTFHSYCHYKEFDNTTIDKKSFLKSCLKNKKAEVYAKSTLLEMEQFFINIVQIRKENLDLKNIMLENTQQTSRKINRL